MCKAHTKKILNWTHFMHICSNVPSSETPSLNTKMAAPPTFYFVPTETFLFPGATYFKQLVAQSEENHLNILKDLNLSIKVNKHSLTIWFLFFQHLYWGTIKSTHFKCTGWWTLTNCIESCNHHNNQDISTISKCSFLPLYS